MTEDDCWAKFTKLAISVFVANIESLVPHRGHLIYGSRSRDKEVGVGRARNAVASGELRNRRPSPNATPLGCWPVPVPGSGIVGWQKQVGRRLKRAGNCRVTTVLLQYRI
jgi:hypothetical protein